MINIKHFPFRLSVSLTFVAVMLFHACLPAQAQTGNQSDVTGSIVTTSDVSGGRFSPSKTEGGGGRVEFENNTIETSVNQSAGIVLNQLAINNLSLPTGQSISPQIQQAVLSLLTTVPSSNGNQSQIVNELSAGGNASTRVEVRQLVNSLKGLIKTISRNGNNSQIKVNPSKLLGAVNAYNKLINNSSAEFLNNPPPALLAIQSVLSQLLNSVQ
ncbi:hypothetical protein G7B40_009990 [Aetokthonos hydrillicola Thurmond2011]|jgi:hypothetical protein|uniref:Secreted protein n=1 Tax=Aetokthonos hydrillicola Thurmond2011 TaxID=2712845 RepID=A0AAP5I6Y1_9CYAN|nr:hypothetical protein [Aetokthonos hydrillicola]MBO3463500.1 hypothetical protein [Aetokthonos hydrillicola CCALA 1050]MBW4590053.1 hypothetical protein [Aetokthonos hydrillicola CCALA 1050]MDR9894894.1 hypothetical protein [Aetokthonos hydrillicola Thurmond2011]